MKVSSLTVGEGRDVSLHILPSEGIWIPLISLKSHTLHMRHARGVGFHTNRDLKQLN